VKSRSNEAPHHAISSSLLSFHPSLVRDQASHPYKTTGKIIVFIGSLMDYYYYYYYYYRKYTVIIIIIIIIIIIQFLYLSA
jgi:hypothetical protein